MHNDAFGLDYSNASLLNGINVERQLRRSGVEEGFVVIMWVLDVC